MSLVTRCWLWALALLFAFAMTWAGACAGMLLRSAEAAQAMGFIVFLPLSFVSNAFVPTQGMPSWLRDFANRNPLSAAGRGRARQEDS